MTSSHTPGANLAYGSWKSPLGTEELTRGVTGFADLQYAANALFLLESRPEEAGRSTLIMLDPNIPDDIGIELTPAPLNVRSRVHEYGGGAFLATDSSVYFVNFSDQNIFVVDLEMVSGNVTPSPPRQLTQTDSNRRYADFALDAHNKQLVAVCEQHLTPGSEPKNSLVSIALSDASEHELHATHDFYAAPRLNPQDQQLAFVGWDHPHMPWDESKLYRASLTAGLLKNTQPIEGASDESITQPVWLNNGDLMFTSDRSGFWNLHVHAVPNALPLCPDEAEYASPAWVFGIRESLQLANGDLAAIRQQQGLGELSLLSAGQDPLEHNHQLTKFNTDFAGYHALCASASHLFTLADSRIGFATLIAIRISDGQVTKLRSAGNFALARVSIPEAIEITNRRNEETHAWLYLPTHPHTGSNAGASDEERPPLLVLSHGGPTSQTSPALNPRIQYYTSRGWAVADVNYGGSTGYGRAYRERLRNQWGLVDVHDCEDIALALAQSDRVDPSRMAIKGGSAGGYTTLAALTFGNVFAAGASHYGIGDLTALAQETHKFEARYIDGLIPKNEWHSRSPINSVDDLSCPVIFFQGSDDAVVPPGQAQAMVAALKAKSLPVAYVEFAGEGHGFRGAKNIQHAAAAEYQFFCKVFGITPGDPPIELQIDNLP